MTAVVAVYAGLLVIFLLAYALTARRVAAGLRPPAPVLRVELPKATVVVAARNEEGSIGACLEALSRQDYPAERYEVLVVDDGSSDRTAEIAEDFCRDRPNFRLLRTAGEVLPGLSGKQTAMHLGISAAAGDVIAATDADCVPPPTWLGHMVSHLAPGVALVGGISLPGSGLESRGLRGAEACDHLFLQLIAAGFANGGSPLSVIGNNIAFRKSAYEAVGGYPALGFSLTEDTQFLAAVRDRRLGGIAYNLSPETVVRSSGARGLRDLFSQRLRWLAGGHRTGRAILWPLAAAFGLHLLVLPVGAALIVGGGWAAALPAGAALGLKSALDLAIMRKGAALIGRGVGAGKFAAFELFYLCYTLVFGVLGLFRSRRIAWKGRTYP